MDDQEAQPVSQIQRFGFVERMPERQMSPVPDAVFEHSSDEPDLAMDEEEEEHYQQLYLDPNQQPLAELVQQS